MYRILIILPALKAGDTASATPGEPVRDIVLERGAAYFIGTLSHKASSAALLVEVPLTGAQVTAHLNASAASAFPGFFDQVPAGDSFLTQFQDEADDVPSVLRCSLAYEDVSGEGDLLSVTSRPVPGWLTAQVPALVASAVNTIRGE